MKKAAIIFGLLCVIILSMGFVILRFQAQGEDDNYFNQELRSRFAVYPFWRQLLGLKYDGDARADYLGNRYQRILIEVDEMEGLNMSQETLQLLAQKIQSITGKDTSFLVSDRKVPYTAELSQENRAKLIKQYRDHKIFSDTATVYLLYASRDPETPTELGATYQEFGIILFGDALKEFIESNPKALGNYEESTALHEFGHQLGLPHNSEFGCLMNEFAEQAHVARERPQNVIIDFCEYEKNEIRNLTSLPLAITLRGTLSSAGERIKE